MRLAGCKALICRSFVDPATHTSLIFYWFSYDFAVLGAYITVVEEKKGKRQEWEGLQKNF